MLSCPCKWCPCDSSFGYMTFHFRYFSMLRPLVLHRYSQLLVHFEGLNMIPMMYMQDEIDTKDVSGLRSSPDWRNWSCCSDNPWSLSPSFWAFCGALESQHLSAFEVKVPPWADFAAPYRLWPVFATQYSISTAQSVSTSRATSNSFSPSTF